MKGFLGAFETKSSWSVCGCICLGTEIWSESHVESFQLVSLESLSKDVFERRKSTGSRRFAFLGCSFAYRNFGPNPICLSQHTKQYKFGSVKAK